MKQGSKGLAVLLFVLCVCVTGCGGEFSGVTRAVSDSAISGSAVSGTAVRADEAVSKDAIKAKNAVDWDLENRKKQGGKYRYSTDTNVYYAAQNADDEYCIMQARFDGTHKKEIWNTGEKYKCYLHYVDENWLYYEFEKKDEYVLYRAPIEKDAEGYDVVKKSGKEVLISEEAGVNDSFWDFPYMIYNDRRNIVKYDLQKKQTVCEYPYADEYTEDEEIEFKYFRLGEGYVILRMGDVEGNIILYQEVTGTEWNGCGDDINWIGFDFDMTQTANHIFYTVDDKGVAIRDTTVSVWKCDGKEIEQFMTRGQIEQALETAKGMEKGDKIDVYEINNIFAQDDRCYVQIELGWYDGEVYRMEYLLFSQGEEESELRYEKELTEKMQSCTESRSGAWGDPYEGVKYLENVVVNDANCFYMMDGYLYLSIYDFKNDRGKIGRYGLHTGEFRWLSKSEAKYGELGCVGIYEEMDLDEIFELWEIDFCISPTKDKEKQGDFYETKK